MRRYLIFFSLMAVVLFTACQGSRTGHSATDNQADSLATDSLMADSLDDDFSNVVVPKAADELFDDFIFNFAGNRKVQLERIVFPLKVLENGRVNRVGRNQWKTDDFFMRQGYYTLLFDSEQHMAIVKDTSITRAVVEKIVFDQQLVRQYIFNRIRNTWMMTSINEIALDKSHNASFLDFYHHFASDPDYQAAHLEKTVGFVGPDPDDDFSQMEGIITPDTWEAFAPQLPSKILYNITYGRPRPDGNRKIFVLRGISNGLEIQLTFRKYGEKWRLSKLIT